MKSLEELRAAVELFVPRHCAVCGATGSSSGLCRLCQRIVGLELSRPQLVDEFAEKLPIFAAGEYNGVLARCLLGYKENLRTDLLDVLSSGLARSISKFSDANPVVLVPIPSSTQSIGRRGFSPAADLARAACHKTKPSLRHNLLVTESLVRAMKLKKISSQKQMGRFDRQRQIRDTMKIKKGADFRGVPCILVDDVVTTGASLLEAKRVLEDAGATVIGAATVAWVKKQRKLE